MESDEQLKNKRISIEPNTNGHKKKKNEETIEPSKQLLIIKEIQFDEPKSKLSLEWYQHWENYCIGSISERPSSIIDQGPYMDISFNALRHLEDWYGKEKETKEEWVIKIFIVDQAVNQSMDFKITSKTTLFEFQSQLTHINHVWLLNTENKFFFNTLNSTPHFKIIKALLNQDHARYAKRIDLFNLSLDLTVLSCLKAMSTLGPYYLAIELLEQKQQHPKKQIENQQESKIMTLGLCGLENIGNSCYLNSALQCLSNTPQLTRYFLSNEYKRDINRSSRLGLKGDLAEAYSLLLKSIWKPQFKTTYSISPRDFKKELERRNGQFSGYEQHDSQELLSCVLDGLHEDLNKITQKPYVESSNLDDLSEAEIATRAWNYHKSREDSIIVDLFQGQYKSRLCCNVCNKVSTTFDTFMYLSLPIKKKFQLTLIYVPYLPSERLLSITLQLNLGTTLYELKKEVSKYSKPKEDHHLCVVKIENQKIVQYLNEQDMIEPKDQIYLYELPNRPIQFPVYCSVLHENQTQLFGHPIMLSLDQTSTDLYPILLTHLERYCIIKLFEEDPAQQATPQPARQHPIQTTAAVRAASGRGLKPMLDLFKIKFIQDGVLLEWQLHKALQIFGGRSGELNREAWFDFTLIESRLGLKDCLEGYTAQESLVGSDAWFCPSCQDYQESTKKIDIWTLPEVLVIQLKRFDHDRKVNRFVDFPIEDLDLSDFVLNQEHALYDLYAINNHYGGLNGGHYTSFVKNVENSNWYEFDDGLVTPLSLNRLKTNAAYLLFYKKKV